ncbi:ErpY protein [Actinobacillus equuli]|uniref:ErpY protein n=1 Tax=Actinobacillus equuli TaxID=718 RepID=UPI0024413C41|nr:ErpY protein [Actinobacillus equuli]WGE57550.1 ErpY protein [Actinobacillus equuli subsp. equuli]
MRVLLVLLMFLFGKRGPTLFSLSYTLLTSCVIDVQDPIVRIWNDGIRPSKSEMNIAKQCLDDAYKKYPNVENEYYDRMEYVRECMKE